MNKVYKKFNSFLELKVKNEVNQNFFLEQLKRILDTEINRHNFSKNEKKIFDQVLIDLFNPPKKNYTKFSLTPNVIKEIQTLKVEQIINYLIHRYRYEIYPQMQIKDDYPPYLQIEPTSICNFRCVFCYQTDNFFNKRSHGYMGHMNFDTFKLIIDQAGIRPKILSHSKKNEDFIFDWADDNGWLDLWGIESPGLTSSLAIGEHVYGMFDQLSILK